MADWPDVRSEEESPRCPPLSCQHPLMTLVIDRLSPIMALGNEAGAVASGADGGDAWVERGEVS